MTGFGLYIRRHDGRLQTVLDRTHRGWFATPDVRADGLLAATVEARWPGARSAQVAVLLVEPSGAVRARLTVANGLRTGAVAGLAFDHDGSLWMASAYGLDRLDLPVATVELALPSEHGIHQLRLAPDGALWASTWAGVFRIDGDDVRRVGPEEGTGGVAFSPSGHAEWIAWPTGAGDAVPFRFHSRRAGLRGERVSLGGGRQFAAVLPDGAALYADVGNAQDGKHPDLVFEEGRVLRPSSGGDLQAAGRAGGRAWIAVGGRLDSIEGQELASRAGTTPPSVRAILARLAGTEVRGLARDRWGHVWVATRAGLARLRERRADTWALHVFDRTDGLLDDLVHHLSIADGERLWVSTPRGVQGFRLGREGGLHPIPLPALLSQLPVASVMAAVEDPEGRLWVAPSGPPRLYRFDWRRARAGAPPSLRAPLIRANGYAVTPGTRLRVDTARVTVALAPASLRQARSLRYEYRLLGIDSAWAEVPPGAALRFDALPSGDHVFEARARYAGGVPGPVVRAALRMVPPFWRAGWFLALCVLLAAGTSGAGVWRRSRAQEARRRELERIVAERTADLAAEKATTEAQAQRLEAADRAKSRFFAYLSHELRTPLTLIQGPLHDARSGRWGPLPDGAARHLGIAEQSAERLLRLVRQFLDLARLDAGQIRLRVRPTDLGALVLETVGGFAVRAEAEGVVLSAVVPPRPLVATVDRDRMEEVLSNLVANALRFTPEGGRVRVTLDAEAETAVVTVQDSGMGIDPALLPHVFDAFRQGEGERRRGHTGLGLALVREVAERHGGHVRATSEPGFGSIFTLRVPLSPAALPEDAELLAAGTEVPLGAGGGAAIDSDLDGAPLDDAPADAPLVLVVEDDPDLADYLRACLADRYRVEIAADGVAGLARARALQPALVLSDVMMPRLGGLALCRALKADAHLGHVPVLLLTARDDEATRLDGLSGGADDYLTKPFSTAELRARAENLIEVRRRLRQRYAGRLVGAPAEIEVASADAAWLRTVVGEVEAHLADAAFTVDALADALAMSTRALQRRLKAASGLSPNAFVRTVRLERAAKLLEGGAGTVAEVARAVGFSDPDYFARVFRQGFGTPPSAYPEHAEPEGA